MDLILLTSLILEVYYENQIKKLLNFAICQISTVLEKKNIKGDIEKSESDF